jgi:hypothetical protein
MECPEKPKPVMEGLNHLRTDVRDLAYDIKTIKEDLRYIKLLIDTQIKVKINPNADVPIDKGWGWWS